MGTLTPDSKFQVNGSVKIDSSLVVSDSAVFKKQARMKDKVVVEGDAVIHGTLKAKNNFVAQGNARFNGNVKMDNLNQAQASDTSLLFLDANGKLEKGSALNVLGSVFSSPSNTTILKDIIYASPTNGEEACAVDFLGNIIHTSPHWEADPQRMFILNTTCNPDVKLGVGVQPQAKFHVLADETATEPYLLIEKGITGQTAPQKIMELDNAGSMYARNLLLGDVYTAPNTFSMLTIKNTNRGAALAIDATGNNNNYNKLLYLQYDASAQNTEIINASKAGAIMPTFLVNGDGSFYFYNGAKKILQMDNQGVIKSRAIYIDTQNWPDFVFEKDYKLPTLAETEQYIKENGHLPGVPSAEQIETEGLNVAATNKMLMQKVEELTLHLIAQEKQLKEQAKQLEILQEKLNN